MSIDTNRPWYKDRDFPEVKSSNSDIVAVIENPKQLQKVIDEHNDLLKQLAEAWTSSDRWKKRAEDMGDKAHDTWDELEKAKAQIEELTHLWAKDNNALVDALLQNKRLLETLEYAAVRIWTVYRDLHKDDNRDQRLMLYSLNNEIQKVLRDTKDGRL